MTVKDAGGDFQEEATEVWMAKDLNSKFAKTAYTSLGVNSQRLRLLKTMVQGMPAFGVVGFLSAISSLSIIVICIHVLADLLQGSRESLGWTCT